MRQGSQSTIADAMEIDCYVCVHVRGFSSVIFVVLEV
jgi:hypothetical protein